MNEKVQKQNEKHFIRVIADMRPNLQIMPLKIVWEDGREFKVESVNDVRQILVSGLGEVAMAYFCVIKGVRRTIYLDRNMQWFVI